MPKKCPDEVIAAGRALIDARKLAWNLSETIDEAIAQLGPAVDTMVKGHGSKRMSAGPAYTKLRQAQMAYGLICEAHDALRAELGKRDVEEPTDDQVASIR